MSEFPERKIDDLGGGVTYVPFVADDGRVGYRVLTDQDEETYIYFNPSANSVEAPDKPNVFVYIGAHNSADEDEPQHFYAFNEEDFSRE